MSVLLISYDLRKSAFDYQPLYEALRRINAKNIHDSLWGVRTNSSPAQVFDELWQFLHSEKDRLLVVSFDHGDGHKARNCISKLEDL